MTLYRFSLGGADVEVNDRPLDKFTAEEQLGYDPTEAVAVALDSGVLSNKALGAMAGMAWAAYCRVNNTPMPYREFLAALDTEVQVVEDDDDAEPARPTDATASSA